MNQPVDKNFWYAMNRSQFEKMWESLKASHPNAILVASQPDADWSNVPEIKEHLFPSSECCGSWTGHDAALWSKVSKELANRQSDEVLFVHILCTGKDDDLKYGYIISRSDYKQVYEELFFYPGGYEDWKKAKEIHEKNDNI